MTFNYSETPVLSSPPSFILPDAHATLGTGGQYADSIARFILRLAALVITVLLGVLALMPYERTVDAYGTLRPATVWPVRAQQSGLLYNVLVEPGQTVEAGQAIARLDTTALYERRLELKAEQRLYALLAARSPEWAARQVGLETQIGLLNAQKERLVLRAPAGGVVLTSDLAQRKGERLEAGQTVLGVGRAGAVCGPPPLSRKRSQPDSHRPSGAPYRGAATANPRSANFQARSSTLALAPEGGQYYVDVALDATSVCTLGANRLRMGFNVQGAVLLERGSVFTRLHAALGA